MPQAESQAEPVISMDVRESRNMKSKKKVAEKTRRAR
jgi:hypothetical protein